MVCTGDALDENFDLNEDEEDADEDDDGDGSQEEDGSEEEPEQDAKDVKRAAQAAGSHPLQQSLRAAASELLRKYGVATEDAGVLMLLRDLCTATGRVSGVSPHEITAPQAMLPYLGDVCLVQVSHQRAYPACVKTFGIGCR